MRRSALLLLASLVRCSSVVFSSMVRRGGIMAVDNTLWSGWVADRGNNDDDTVALRKFNDKLHRDERIEIALLPLGDGVTLALKK